MSAKEGGSHKCTWLSPEFAGLMLSRAYNLCKERVRNFQGIDFKELYETKDQETITFLAIVTVMMILGLLAVRLACLPVSLLMKAIKRVPFKLSFVYGNSLAYCLTHLAFAYAMYTKRLEDTGIYGVHMPTSFVIFAYRLCSLINAFLPTYLPTIAEKFVFLPHPALLYQDSIISYRALLASLRGLSSFLVSIGAGFTFLRLLLFLVGLGIYGYAGFLYFPTAKQYIMGEGFMNMSREDQVGLCAQLAGFLIDLCLFCVEVRNIRASRRARSFRSVSGRRSKEDGLPCDEPECLSSGSEPTDTGDVIVQSRTWK